MQDLLDIKEAAAFLRVSETSLRRWTNAGRLRCFRIGGRRERRFRRADLEAFLGGASHAGQHFCGDVRRAVVAQLDRDRTTSRDLRAGRLLQTEYRDSAAAQIDYWRSQVRTALEDGVSRVFVVGDVSAGALGKLPLGEILEYEVEFTRSIADPFPVTTLCQYDARSLSGLEAAGLLQCHDGAERTYRLQH
ncbi:MAG: hypothetical protein AUH41_07175 [Gemmatimonadetes bacterium 13_1_40CM_66_11]|nr:MAG: hypothetical protein AUH41_07175 [Gemmatimonadetes bacterium 13_1_40CM_66_11]